MTQTRTPLSRSDPLYNLLAEHLLLRLGAFMRACGSLQSVMSTWLRASSGNKTRGIYCPDSAIFYKTKSRTLRMSKEMRLQMIHCLKGASLWGFHCLGTQCVHVCACLGRMTAQTGTLFCAHQSLGEKNKSVWYADNSFAHLRCLYKLFSYHLDTVKISQINQNSDKIHIS